MKQYRIISLLVAALFLGSAGEAVKTPPVIEAFAALSEGRYTEAEALFEESAEDGGSSQAGRIGLMKTKTALGKNDEALLLIKEAIEEEPGRVDLYLYEGSICEKTEDAEAAAAAYESVLALDPEHRVAMRKLIALYRKHHDADGLKDCFSRLLAAEPDNAGYIGYYVSACLEAGDDASLSAYMDSLGEDAPFGRWVKSGVEAYKALAGGDMKAVIEILSDTDTLTQGNDSGEVMYIGSTDGQGRPDGKGVCFYGGTKSHSAVYAGEWKTGLREGHGAAVNGSISSYSNEGQKFVQKMIESVEGPWAGDLPEGEMSFAQLLTIGNSETGEEEHYQLSLLSGTMRGGLGQGTFIMRFFGSRDADTSGEYGQYGDYERYDLKDGIPVAFEAEGKQVYRTDVYSTGMVYTYDEPGWVVFATWDA